MALNLAPIIENARRTAGDYRFDSYTVVRVTRTPDDAGGWTEAEGVVEAGTCVLTAGATRPEEREIADRITASVPMIVRNMPHNSLVTPADTIVIAGRVLQVIGVLRTEAANVAVTAICEEQT